MRARQPKRGDVQRIQEAVTVRRVLVGQGFCNVPQAVVGLHFE